MSSNNKLLLSVSLASLTLFSLGCNSNLSTGHPNQKPGTTPVSAAATTPTNNATNPSTAVVKTTAGTSQTIDPNFAGTFACDTTAGSGFDNCMADETIFISTDFTMLTLEVTGAIAGAPDCHTIDDATLSAPTTDQSGKVVTVKATFNPWALDTAGKNDTTCTTAFTQAKLAGVSSGTITLDVSDPTGNFLIYTNGDVHIQLTRVDPVAAAGQAAPAAPLQIVPLPPANAPAAGAAAAAQAAPAAQDQIPANEAQAAAQATAQAQNAVQQAATAAQKPAAAGVQVPAEIPANGAGAAAQQH